MNRKTALGTRPGSPRGPHDRAGGAPSLRETRPRHRHRHRSAGGKALASAPFRSGLSPRPTVRPWAPRPWLQLCALLAEGGGYLLWMSISSGEGPFCT